MRGSASPLRRPAKQNTFGPGPLRLSNNIASLSGLRLVMRRAPLSGVGAGSGDRSGI